MQALLNGMQFRKLLEKEYSNIETDYDLKKIDIQILQYLKKAGQYDTARDIVALGLFTKGHVSQSLANLKAQGLVEPVHDESDNRCIHLMLTDEAIELIKQIETIYEKILQIMFKDIPEEDQEVFKRVGTQIVKNIKTYI